MAAAKKKTAKKKTKKASAKGKSLVTQHRSEGKQASAKAKVYSPGDTYKKGELVFHPVWGDEGPVVEIGATEDGIQKVIVDFEEIGLKHLVMKHDLSI